jgi:hypothetical protein
MDDAALAGPAWCGPSGSAGDHPALASRWFQCILAVEIPKAGRAAENKIPPTIWKNFNQNSPNFSGVKQRNVRLQFLTASKFHPFASAHRAISEELRPGWMADGGCE